jgi:hypothetical protein
MDLDKVRDWARSQDLYNINKKFLFCSWTVLRLIRLSSDRAYINPLNAELNPICHLLALLEGATIVVVSRLRVNIRISKDLPDAFHIQYDLKRAYAL